MLRPGGSSLSLRAIGSSLRNLNSISTEHLDERILLLMPPVGPNNSNNNNNNNANGTQNLRSNNNLNATTTTTTTTNSSGGKRYGDRLSVYEYNSIVPSSTTTPPYHQNRHEPGALRVASRSVHDLSPVESCAREDDHNFVGDRYIRKSNESSAVSVENATIGIVADKTVLVGPDEYDDKEAVVVAGGGRLSVGEVRQQQSSSLHISSSAEAGDSSTKTDLTQLYFKRWIILAVFCMITLINSFNWIEYGIIQDVVIAFYNASLPQDEAQQIDAVNWFSMVYMLTYIPLVFPAMFLLERKGLRLSCVLGALLTFVGACVKCAAVRPDLFAVAMLGQTICAIAQSFTLGIPARLSALWFGPDEIGLATSIGVFGNQLGTALGFLIPPNIVVKSDSVEFMQRRFYYLLIPVAALCGIAFILAILLVKDQPEKPPSMAQMEIRKSLDTKDLEESDLRLFKSSLKDLFKNFNYCLILVSYGVNTGVYYSIGTLLNLIISKYYENENEKIGIIGLILVLSGLIGAVVGGIILDKTKAFKLTTFVIYACSFAALVLFTFTLSINIWIVFGTSFLLGFFMTGYLPVGFELAAEVTYPASEGTSCGLLNTSAQIFGIFFTYIQGRIVVKVNALAGNLFVSGALLIGTIITALVKSDLRRQKAINIIIEQTTTHTSKETPPDDSNFESNKDINSGENIVC